MRELLSRLRWFLIPLSIWLTGGTLLHFFYSKHEVQLMLNPYHSPWIDTLFRYLTHVGDGLLVIGLTIVLAIVYRFRSSLVLLGVYLSSGILVQLGKKILFPGMERPAKYFLDYPGYHFVPGVELHHWQSFPSGHSATAFGLFICLAYFTRNIPLQFAYFCLALLVAFTRVYLSQHYVIDTLAGAFMGVACAIMVFYYFNRVRPGILDRNFLSLIKKKSNE